MRILITGHKGFVGSHYVRHFENQNHDVVGVDIKWQEPMDTDLTIDTNILRQPSALALEIYNALKLKLAIQ